MTHTNQTRLRNATVLCAFALGAMPALAQQLLVNPGFENPGCAGNCVLTTPAQSSFISGWTLFNSGVEYFQANLFGGSAPEGLMIVDLANFTFSAGGIQQTFATTPGQRYTLQFWAGNQLSSGRTGTGNVRVQVAGFDQTVATAVATSSAYAWRLIDLSFTAIAASSTLQFSNNQNASLYYAFIDGVSVTPVPEPGVAALMLAGLLASVGMARRRGMR